MQTLQISSKTHTKKLDMPSFVLALVLLISLDSLTSSCTEQERGSLLQFLAGLSQNGGLAASWENGTDCCKWEGITCGQDRTVTHVLLPFKGLEGNISRPLGILDALQLLDLSHNSLSSGLSSELVSSSSITILDVSFNQLNGTLHELPSSALPRPLQWQHPPSLGNCSRLRELGAGYNHLTGVIPNELFNAKSLEYLPLPNNDLHGAIDGTNITNLKNHVTLDLGRNNFSGRIPVFIGQLKKLEELRLNNNMSGELPSADEMKLDIFIWKNVRGATICCEQLYKSDKNDLKSNNLSGKLTTVNFSNLPNKSNTITFFAICITRVAWTIRSIYSVHAMSKGWHSGNTKQAGVASLHPSCSPPDPDQGSFYRQTRPRPRPRPRTSTQRFSLDCPRASPPPLRLNYDVTSSSTPFPYRFLALPNRLESLEHTPSSSAVWSEK
ncbi:Tyrosine-sulfated glycopeptide receptor 1 [Hordeum vulgare]|nr:Tyrosine-sulfated glycopeptide receptor 1 [Hordeum vulgare]